MYDNEIYGHDNVNRPTDSGVIGNFSGASTAGFNNQEADRQENVNPQYIPDSNHPDDKADIDTPVSRPQSAIPWTTNDAVMTSVQEPTPSDVIMPLAQEPTPDAVTGTDTQAQAFNDMVTTSVPIQNSNDTVTTSVPTQTSNDTVKTSVLTQTSNDAARTSTWTQASIQHTDDQSHKHGDKKMGLAQKIMLSISLGLFFGIFAGIGFFGVMQMNNAAQGKEQGVIEQPGERSDADTGDIVREDSPRIQQAGSNVVYASSPDSSVTGIVKDVMPAMVSIINNYTETTSFWGQTYREELSASGSGIIVAENGEELLIVTNQHVVSDADELWVTLSDDTEVEAKIKGTDAEMDLAVIAIRLEDLSSETMDSIAIANLGDSDSLELGERVIAIGNALGYGQSVTVGYISALDRELELDDGSARTFIQTDAAINPGNSGGALLNSAGEVIGINSNKIGGSSIEGMGYAIPISAASPIIADLMERRTRDKVADSDMGYLGISPQDISSQIAQMYGMPEGVYVLTVYEDSGAEAAGIVKGDIITKFDGDKISSFSDLQKVLQYYAVGDTVKVTIMHPQNGEYVEKELTLTLGKKPVSRSKY